MTYNICKISAAVFVFRFLAKNLHSREDSGTIVFADLSGADSQDRAM
jgi:hypothetical protein